MNRKKFPIIKDYPITANEYKEREKAYAKEWQILFFFIAVLSVMSYFLPEVAVNYILKLDIDRLALQITGVLFVIGVLLLSRMSRRALAKNYGLSCPECGEIFDYWSDKKNAVTFGGVCPKCNFKITDIQDTGNDNK